MSSPGGRRRIASAAAAVAVSAVVAAGAARSAVPEPAKIARAVAEANGVSGRSAPLLFQVRLRIDGAAPSAEGELAAHPSGLARLELRNHRGFVERHLLQSDAYQASRDGELLDDPHPFLPPIFLLQASSGDALAAALASFGIADHEVVLGRLGARDCYVFGGRVPPRGSEAERLLPSLWIDMVSLDPLRIVRGDGVEYRFGPIQVYGRIRMPSWIDVVTSEGLRARLEITSARRAEAPAALFQPNWLTAPANSPAAR